MKIINSQIKEKNEAELTIDVTPEEFGEALNKAYLKNRGRINVPGFRKGKAPRKMIEKMYGIAIFMNDALDDLYPKIMEFALKNEEFDIVGYPKISDIDLKDNDTRAEIKLIVALRPEVILGKYKGLSAPKPDLTVTDEEVMKEIETMQKRNARLETVERKAKSGDLTVIDFEGFLDGEPFDGGKGENYELELGSGRFIPGFEDKLIGMNPGDERDIDIVFPEDYHEHLAGKAVVFKVKLHEIKEKILPELDDEFAKDVSEFDTLDEYKQSIREKIEKTRQAEIDETFEELLMEQLIADIKVDVPQAMLDEQTDRTKDNFTKQISAYGMNQSQYMKMMGISEEEYEEKLRENVEKRVKITLALEEIAKKEGIEITKDDVEEEYKRVAEEYKSEVDKIKESIEEDLIEHDLLIRAAAKIIKDNAKIEKVKPDKPKNSTKKKEDSK